MSRTKRIRYLKQVEDITALLESDAFRAHGLAMKLGISVRSTHRLLNDLRAVGLPIQVKRHGLQLWYYMESVWKRHGITVVVDEAKDMPPETAGVIEHIEDHKESIRYYPPPDTTSPEIVTPEPTNAMPPSPASRVEFVQRLVENNLVDPEQGRKLLDTEWDY